STFTSSFLVIRNNFKYLPWVILILILPQVVKNNIVHLRQGLALSFFLIGWYSSNKKTKNIFFLISPLIHSSFFFFILILCISDILKKNNLSNGIRTIVVVIFSLILSVSVPIISIVLKARQAESYNYIGTPGSGIAFLF